MRKRDLIGAVVKAAVRWVEFEDTGTIAALHELTRRQQALVRAVDLLERRKPRRKGAPNAA